MNNLEQQNTTEAFKFTGNGGEYFKIWIVNILLSVITLGIYSAWAKVRTERYFYGNTQLSGHNFEYHAKPLTILRGRIIAVTVFIAYILGGQLFPIVSIILALAVFILSPWIIMNSLRFNARMSSFRGIHFDFKARYGEIIVIFILLPIASIFTLFLLLPYAIYRQVRFMMEHHYYGQTSFKFSAKAGEYYIASLISIGISIVGFLLIGLAVSGSMSEVFLSMQGQEELPPSVMFALIPFLFLIYLPMIVAGLFFRVQTYNIAFNNLSVKDNQFQGNMKLLSWSILVIKNFFLILITLGLYYPWAKIDVARYKAGVTSVAVSDIDSFIASEKQQQGALGDELGEVFDIGVGI